MGCQQSDLRVPGPGRLVGGNARTAQGPERPTVPAVVEGSWYAQPFTEHTRMSLTDFHMKHRGAVVFSRVSIPVSSSQLDEFPGRSPPLSSSLELGRDFVYAVAFLFNTPLFIEHQWRLRVSHYLDSCARKGQPQQGGQNATGSDEDSTNVTAAPTQALCPASEEEKTRLAGLHRTVYGRPFFDTLIGVKVFVDDQLVPDKYPTNRSLPNCTGTIETSEAFNNWICVPLVLFGYVNSNMVGTISLYRRLSLSFVEYMLEQPINGEEHGDAGKEEKEGGGTEVFTVRVEVVYGCRMERNFCTDFIAKGSVELSMSKQSKALLSSYRERLLKLLAAGNAGKQQVVPMDTLMLVEQQRASANCLFCNGQLRYICTICGARLCGAASCVWKPFVGYPHGCSSHKAQL